ncbi:MAG: site-specific integrase [Lachnospiraceae bacterium]|nr:site-specific integrase [Lachnospiraceae bacterium]
MFELKLQNYIDWNVKPVFKRKERDRYAYRVVLIFEDGSKHIKQHSGFMTKKEAEDARKITMGELSTRTYIINDNVRLEEFLEYWLEYEIRKRAGSSNTYDSYSNIARHHIIPMLGKKRLTEIHKGDVQRLYEDRAAYSKSIASQTKVVMNVSLRFAVTSGLLAVNPAEGIILPKSIESKPYHTRNIDMAKTLNMEQIQRLLEMSEDTPIHMQVLFNVLMGLRRQEINAVKYSDVDYINRTLSAERQLGKQLNREPYGVDEKPVTKKELPLKTMSSRRVLPIPDYVFEAILQERKVYERNRSRNGKRFLDADYICCSTYGKPRSKDFHWSHYKKLLQDAGLPDIRWHDLRSTYCTLLLKSDFNPKAVSELMGHAKEIITMDVYGDNANIIPEEIPELLSYMEKVMPHREEAEDDDISKIEIDVSRFLKENKSAGCDKDSD